MKRAFFRFWISLFFCFLLLIIPFYYLNTCFLGEHPVLLIILTLVALALLTLFSWFSAHYWLLRANRRTEWEPIVDRISEGICLIDADRRIQFLNRSAINFIGKTKEELLGQPFDITNLPKCSALVEEAFMVKKPVMSVLKPNEAQTKSIDITAFYYKKFKLVVLLFQDQTNMYKAVELARDFIANASHELKTPITIIRGFSETLHEHPDLSDEVVDQITQKLVINCRRMEAIIKNLLALAAIEEGIQESRLERCHVQELAEKAKQTILASHPNANISTYVEKGLSFSADKELLCQALINLLDNAIKYSTPNDNIIIRGKQEEGHVIIEVEDHGKGIPKEKLERIFERFYAVDKSLSSSLGGYGLGLSIVEQIVEKHKGKISVTSAVGEGTTFTLSFPL